MIDLIADKVFDPRTMGIALTAVAVAATAFAVAQPFLESDNLGKRMKLVSDEREIIRRRERERLNTKATLRIEPKAYMKQVVERFDLRRWLGTDTAKRKLLMAGYRGQQSETTFLFFRLVMPISATLGSLFYLFVLEALDQPYLMRFGIVIACAYGGIKAPELYLVNKSNKRKAEIKLAWPDALDLTLICVESGMAIEHAFRKVSTEIAATSVVLAEELALMTAEMSFLPDRRQAYENLAMRVGLEPVKAVVTALIQAERYGTPIGQALRVLAQESRDQRMNEAEKKAASLPPKLTVPMILFFLPVLFVVIISPAIIQAMR
ncbi:type II secretion system F family protein [Methylobacterium sp. WL30]|uniref:type II secretion system F family protein n=1 Tax=unclassified Methylobacterium TaxID=2615210 RepID=UPI0011CB259A|nr:MULTISPECIES: type II secretion system F family protein [unclassified Methylobacterium]TXM93181.1 type II secretion system F family protein [Methylobacterium sp. WL116]TXN34401.1 type II secretion system F family protein [Methylobacterium sp. WL93]TXN47986.1 type II secretion system F family protein [Methylobacterium sp. WL119]TXN65539.1 type II secretion system F family protein [Methylobacterium sp. WL30]